MPFSTAAPTPVESCLAKQGGATPAAMRRIKLSLLSLLELLVVGIQRLNHSSGHFLWLGSASEEQQRKPAVSSQSEMSCISQRSGLDVVFSLLLSAPLHCQDCCCDHSAAGTELMEREGSTRRAQLHTAIAHSCFGYP